MASNTALVAGGGIQIVDFFATKLTQGLDTVGTTMFLGTVSGIPALSDTAYCLFLIEEGTNFEIVKATSVNAALKSVVITRGYGGTDARSFSREAKVEMRVTSAVMNEFTRSANTNLLQERFETVKSTVDNLSTVATSGSYADLLNTPILFPVATTGSFDDLSNKPNIENEARLAISMDDTSSEGASYNNSNGAIHIASPSSSGDIGALVFAYPLDSFTEFNYGDTITLSGSNRLTPAGISPDDPDGLRSNANHLTNGTWKCLGYSHKWTDNDDGTYFDRDRGPFGQNDDATRTLNGDGTMYVATMWHRIS